MEKTLAMHKTLSIGSDLMVDRMGFGAMRLTGKGVWGPPRDREECLRVLKRAVDLGVNFIDTADSYGPDVSEELIAEALHPYPDGLVIATKGGFMRTGPDQWTINAHPDHLKEALEGSLERLRIDRIDLYQLHRIDPKVPVEKTLEFLQDSQERGLIKHIGLSEVDIPAIEKAEEYVRVVSVQNKYSLDYRKWEPVLSYCEAHGMAFIPWNPINAGNLARHGGAPGAGGISGRLEKLNKLAARAGATINQLALAWLFHHSQNILLIPGTSSVQHLEENVRAASFPLSEEIMDELDRLD